MKYADVDRIYQTIPLENLPWNNEVPPDALVGLVQSGTVRPCKVIDPGCGTGNYAIYLADPGLDMTSVDSSPTAIKIAEEHAEKRGSPCRFVVAALIGDLHEVTGTFDFAYDGEFLHHILPGRPGDLYPERVSPPPARGTVSFRLIQRGRPPVWRHREIPRDPDRDNTLFLLRIRDPGTCVTVLYHRGTENNRSRWEVRFA